MSKNLQENSVIDPTAVLAANLASVRAVGAGIRKSAEATAAIVATAPEGFDYKARGAVTGLIHAWANGDGPVPAVATGGKGEQKPTDYGRGVDALRQTVRKALAGDRAETAPRMQVAMKGVGSAIVPADHPLYAALLAVAAGETPDYAALVVALTPADESTPLAVVA